MADLVCPQCGLVSTVPGVRRAADEFCRRCDYPLFWAPTAVPLAADADTSDVTMRRLPGAAGRVAVGTRSCPTCGELNVMGAVTCIRCGSLLDPPPVVEEPPAPPPPTIVITPPPPAPPPRPWWPWAVGGAALLVLLIVVLFLTR